LIVPPAGSGAVLIGVSPVKVVGVAIAIVPLLVNVLGPPSGRYRPAALTFNVPALLKLPKIRGAPNPPPLPWMVIVPVLVSSEVLASRFTGPSDPSRRMTPPLVKPDAAIAPVLAVKASIS